MTVAATMEQLEALGTEQMRKHNTKFGAGKNQFGVKMGDIRKIAKALKGDHDLALELWKTKNVDARFVAVLLFKPKQLTAKQLERLVKSERFTHLADWLTRYVVAQHPDKEQLREQWIDDTHAMTARAGWHLTATRVAKDPDGLDPQLLLDRIEAEMGDADPAVQWTMNMCLAELGVHFKKHRKRAIKIGEDLGLYRDYPVPKGCTSPFAPEWIRALVERQG